MNFAIFFRKDFFDDKSFFFYFFDDIYKYQDSFRKVYSTLHCVKKSAFNKDIMYCSAILQELSKIFGYLNLKIPIGKLNTYDVSLPALTWIHYFLPDEKQTTRK